MPHYEPVIPCPFRDTQNPGEVFDIIQREHILLHHPYDSFTPVVDFLLAAARDPQVLAIKQTLYRVGQNSPVVEALLEAAERGKQVAVLVELKARFDEESNIAWAKMLEQAGVHVVYGLVGLKIHCKVGMVVRREGETIRRYCHLATGNYNYITANFYEDIGIFTCDEDIATDVTDLFNYLTGYSTMSEYRKLLVAPVNLRQKLEALIQREIKHAQEGQRRVPHFQDEFAHRPGDDPPAVPGFGEGREGRPDRARDVLPGARHGKGEREHPRGEHFGQVSGAQPHLLFP